MNVSDKINYRKLFDKKTIERLLSNTGITNSLTLRGLSLSAFGECFHTWGELGKSTRPFSVQVADHLIEIEIDCEKNHNAVLELIKFTLETNLQKSLLASETLDRYKEINSLFQLSESIRSTRYSHDVANSILDEIWKLLPCTQSSLWLSRKHKYQRLGCKLQLMESVLQYEEEENLIKILIEEHEIADIFVDRLPDNVIQFESLPKCWMFVPLKAGNRKIGGLLLLNPTRREFQSGDLKLAVSLGTQAAFSIENSILFEEIEKVFDGVVRGLIAAIDERDTTTSGHSARIALICERFAKQINATHSGKFKDFHFSNAELREIKYAGLLHDIGKIGVREDVLKKKDRLHPGSIEAILSRLDYVELLKNIDLSRYKKSVMSSNEAYNLDPEDAKNLCEMLDYEFTRPNGSKYNLLTREEYSHLSIKHGNLTWSEIQEMRKHPAGTRKILDKIKFPKELKNLSKIASEHHEKLDGSGYPGGLKGDEILLQSQIMCIADIYEALVDAKRPYKPALSPQEALRILELEVSEQKIDPDLYTIFKENLHAIVPGYSE